MYFIKSNRFYLLFVCSRSNLISWAHITAEQTRNEWKMSHDLRDDLCCYYIHIHGCKWCFAITFMINVSSVSIYIYTCVYVSIRVKQQQQQQKQSPAQLCLGPHEFNTIIIFTCTLCGSKIVYSLFFQVKLWETKNQKF